MDNRSCTWENIHGTSGFPGWEEGDFTQFMGIEKKRGWEWKAKFILVQNFWKSTRLFMTHIFRGVLKPCPVVRVRREGGVLGQSHRENGWLSHFQNMSVQNQPSLVSLPRWISECSPVFPDSYGSTSRRRMSHFVTFSFVLIHSGINFKSQVKKKL